MYVSVNQNFTPPHLGGRKIVQASDSCHIIGLEDNLVQYAKVGDSFCVIYGIIYDKRLTNPYEIYRLYHQNGHKSLLDVDGDFLFFEIHPDGSCVVISDREGDYPVYYREYGKGGLLLSTECSDLFYDFTLDKINERAVNDYLRFGTLIGDETMHREVCLLQGGSELLFDSQNGIRKSRNYRFHYEEQKIELPEITKTVFKAYSDGVKKRISGRENDTCIFLSGGMDSRLLLAVANSVLKEKVSTVTFGQKNSEEVNVARLCAKVHDNEFQWIKVTPTDFVRDAEEYMRMTCCGDMFPQSYIIGASQAIQKKAFATGFALDAYMGGTFLNDDVLDSEEQLSDFLKDHLGLLKMKVFSKEDLEELRSEKVHNPFETDVESVIEEAKTWDAYSVRDSIQAFAIDNRAKRSVALREIVPGHYMLRINPSSDIDFLKAASAIPAEYRLNHRFYHGMFMEYVSDYTEIPYNNTTLPVSAPITMWKQGTVNEAAREKLYAEFMETYNKSHDEKIYYPHYYSDFEGYSRYDAEWRKLFENYLLNPDAVIVNLWFDKDKVAKLYQDHITGRKNNRKKLIFLTSLEIFLKNNVVN